VIATALREAQLDVPYFANGLEWQGGDRWRLLFPHWVDNCRVANANCKCSHGDTQAPAPCVAIGDGRSDFCMSARADYVIAKGTLARHCQDRGVIHATFHDFEDVIAHLAAWLATNRAMVFERT
jgi:hypothetical protein